VDLEGGTVKKILQLCTFNPDENNAGGKIRSFQIKNALRKKFEVKTLSFSWARTPFIKDMHFGLSEEKFLKNGGNHLLGDLGINNYLSQNTHELQHIAQKVHEFNPDVILLEQPYLLPLVRTLKSTRAEKNIPLIYSSHNIEAPMKRGIYENFFTPESVNQLTQWVSMLETEAIKESIMTFVVSEDDARFTRELKRDGNVLVLPNGHWIPKSNNRDKFWDETLSDTKVNWTFVGSAHPPNIEGMSNLLRALPLQEEDWRIIIAGSASVAFKGLTEKVPWLLTVNNPTNDDIDSLILKSSGMLLPIWSGGGSNLKTAQALLSNRTLVGTEYSFRGFESFKDEEGVHLVSTAEEFANMLRTYKPPKSVQRRGVESLTWDFILSDLVLHVESILDVT
jgi:hypothetical protein